MAVGDDGKGGVKKRGNGAGDGCSINGSCAVGVVIWE